MGTWLIVLLVVAWLTTGLLTGAVASHNNHSIAHWPWPGRLGVILMGPLTGIGCFIYAVMYLGTILVIEFVVYPILDFIQGR